MQSPTAVANFNCQLDLESLRRCTPELVCEVSPESLHWRGKTPPQLCVLLSHGLGRWVVFPSPRYCSSSCTAMGHTLKLWATVQPSSCHVTSVTYLSQQWQKELLYYHQGLPMSFKTTGELSAFSQTHGLVTRRPYLPVIPEDCRWNCPTYPPVDTLVRAYVRKTLRKLYPNTLNWKERIHKNMKES